MSENSIKDIINGVTSIVSSIFHSSYIDEQNNRLQAYNSELLQQLSNNNKTSITLPNILMIGLMIAVIVVLARKK